MALSITTSPYCLTDLHIWLETSFLGKSTHLLWDKEVWEEIFLYISGRTLFY